VIIWEQHRHEHSQTILHQSVCADGVSLNTYFYLLKKTLNLTAGCQRGNQKTLPPLAQAQRAHRQLSQEIAEVDRQCPIRLEKHVVNDKLFP